MAQLATSLDTIPEQISSCAKRFPSSGALSDGKRILSYEELDQKSDRLAGHLKKMGVLPGDSAVICMDRSFDWIVAALGIMKIGAAYVPVDPSWPDSRVQFTVNDSRAAVFVGPRERFGLIQVKAASVDLVCDAAAIAASPEIEAQSRDPESLAYIVYTSGSTGVPKGVEITHANLCHLAKWHQEAFGVTSSDRASHLAGLGFDAAVWEIWPSLCAGATLCLASDSVRLSAESIQDWMVEERVTIGFVPTVYAAPMMALKWPSNTALRFLLTGGDTLHQAPHRGLPFKVVNNYGPAECTVVATSGVLGTDEEGLPPIGRAISGAKVYLLDEDRKPVPDGVVGEIYVGGDGVGRGYRNLPEATEQAFVPDAISSNRGARMYRTGDRAVRRPDGALEFRGRVDRQIKIRGQRVELDEIGNTLARHPNIEFAIATTRLSPEGTQHLIGYFLPNGKSAVPSEAELAAHLQKTLPSYMVPSVFVELDSLPLSANGKIDLSQLPERTVAQQASPQKEMEHISEVENRLLGIVQDLLGGHAISVNDNLFLSGGHSLFGMQLISRVRTVFGVDLTLHQLFESPTVHGLAAVIRLPAQDKDTSHTPDLSKLVAPCNPAHNSCQAAINSAAAVSQPAIASRTNGHRAIASSPDNPAEYSKTGFMGADLKGDIEHSTGVLTLHRNGTRIPIFWMHHLAINLAKDLGEDQPFFIFTLTGSDLALLGERPPLKEIAACFVRKILAVQSHGPFILGSLCIGSVLVYEIAQQMRCAGRNIRLLILLDAPTQPYLRSCTSMSIKLTHPGYALQRVMRIGLSKTVENVSKRLIKSIPFSLRLKWFKPDWNTAHELVERAGFVYEPKPYDGEVLLVLSAEAPPHLNFLPGWQAQIRGKLSVAFVDGHHRDFITAQNVGAIAEIVSQHLPEAEAGSFACSTLANSA